MTQQSFNAARTKFIRTAGAGTGRRGPGHACNLLRRFAAGGPTLVVGSVVATPRRGFQTNPYLLESRSCGAGVERCQQSSKW